MGFGRMDQVSDVTSSPTPDPAAVDAVGRELEAFDKPAGEQLAELLGDQPVSDDPAQGLDQLLAEPEPEPRPEPMTPEQEAGYAAAFGENYPDIAAVWRDVDGAEAAAARIRDCGRAAEMLSQEPDVVDAIDAITDVVGLTRLGEVRLWEAIAKAGARQDFGTGGPIGKSKLETYTSAWPREALVEAEKDGLVPAGSVARWLNGERGELRRVMAGRRGIARIAAILPELVELGASVGLHRRPDVWARLQDLGMKAAARPAAERKGANMTAASTDKVGAIKDKLRELQNDPRYWRDRDPAIVKQVERGWAAVSPGLHQSGDSVSQAQSNIARGVSR
jgi:hypothetical protein